MTMTESKVRKGRLTLGTPGADGTGSIDVSCQPTSVSLVPATETSGDPVEVLCGDMSPADTLTTWSLTMTAIQDFDNPQGLVMWAFDHAGETVPYVWRPNAGPLSFSGQVQVAALTIGGEVGKRITSEASWPCTGKPERSSNTGNPGGTVTGDVSATV